MPPATFDWATFVQFSLVSLSSVFFIVDPIAAIPTFLAMTGDHTEAQRRREARHAAWTCFLVLALFALAGSLLFKAFGITLPAFKIAGGILLFLIAIDMLSARRSATQEVSEETLEARDKDDVGVIPLGIPMLAGPGSISAVMVLMGQSPSWWQAAPVFGAIAVTAALSYAIFVAATRIRRYLSDTGIRILLRLMGLVLAAIAVQFVLNGLQDLRVIPRPSSGAAIQAAP